MILSRGRSTLFIARTTGEEKERNHLKLLVFRLGPFVAFT